MTALKAAPSRHARILGVGAYRPARVVTNEELCRRIDSSDEWIKTRTGISERRFAEPDETAVSMGVLAGGKALAAAGVGPEDIDCVILATFTHTHHTPGGAPDIATRLGIEGAAAFDLSAACAGFSYGLALANDLIRSGSARNVLLVGSDKTTDYVDLDDRSTAFLFGDGAGAVVVGPSDEPGIGAPAWGSDGGHLDAITVSVMRAGDDSPVLHMAGQTVFRWAVTTMAPVAHEALELAGLTVDTLDAFIPHQANARIIDAIVKALALPDTVAVSRDVATTGNTSAASIPLAMEAMLSSGESRSGDTALLLGFGAGLVYAGQVVVLP